MSDIAIRTSAVDRWLHGCCGTCAYRRGKTVCGFSGERIEADYGCLQWEPKPRDDTYGGEAE